MRVVLAAVGRGMPAWVEAGFQEYARRLSGSCRLELREIKAPARRGDDIPRVRAREAEQLRAAVADTGIMVALDEGGRGWTTRELAGRLEGWLAEGVDVGLVVGGADGLDDALRREARLVWSLSPLTLPHMLVRVVVAEQIYRAWTITTGHPYHRD